MYNSKYVIPGLIVLVAAFTAPFWLNALSSAYERPALALPTEYKECVETRDYMRAEHMHILNQWRDMALREGKREYVSSTGTRVEINLQNTCMKCHVNKADFCDKCHNSNSVSPYCWDCHVEPRGNQK